MPIMMVAQITPEFITNIYLYGQANRPESPALRQGWVFSWTAFFRLLSIVALIFAVSACGSDRRVCASLNRALSDEELFRVVVRQQIASGRLNLADDDQAFQEFLRRNPRCCGVDRHPPPTSWISRVLDYDLVDVEVNFKVAEEAVKRVGPYYEGHALIGPCGEVARLYGTGTEALESAI